MQVYSTPWAWNHDHFIPVYLYTKQTLVYTLVDFWQFKLWIKLIQFKKWKHELLNRNESAAHSSCSTFHFVFVFVVLRIQLHINKSIFEINRIINKIWSIEKKLICGAKAHTTLCPLSFQILRILSHKQKYYTCSMRHRTLLLKKSYNISCYRLLILLVLQQS